MSRLSQRFQELKAAGTPALTCYIVSGDPDPEQTLPAMKALVEAGADVIELGIPFSDPMAEGPVIQKGHERALAHGVSLRSTLKLVEAFRQSDNTTPVVLMGYANPIERMGYEQFARASAEAGVDAALTVDLPPEEAKTLDAALAAVGLDNIFLVAPTTTDERIDSIVKLARGFIYFVSLKGVTGASHLDIDSVTANLARIRARTGLPVQVGFGIKDAQSAKAVAACADGVVIGSALVALMGTGENGKGLCKKLQDFLQPIRAALNA